jgi:NitT/TauT family transport system substrate-binding protein
MRLPWQPVAAGLLLLAACGPAHAAAALKPWRHGIVEAKGDSAILYMPAEGGFAARRGLDLKMVQFVSANTPVRALVAGELDSIEGAPVLSLAAMHQGADIRIIGCHWPGMTYSLFGAKNIASIADLKGKVIGVSQPASLPDLFAREALLQSGLDPKLVRFANAGGSTDRFRAVTAGVVSAAASSSEFEIEAPTYGVKVLLRGTTATPNFLRSCLMTSSKKIAERRADVVNFLAAAMEGYAYALTHRDRAVAAAHKMAGLKPGDKTAAFVFDEAVKARAVTPDLAIPLDKLRWADAMMVRLGFIDKETDVTRFIDGAPRDAALKLIAAPAAH